MNIESDNFTISTSTGNLSYRHDGYPIGFVLDLDNGTMHAVHTVDDITEITLLHELAILIEQFIEHKKELRMEKLLGIDNGIIN